MPGDRSELEFPPPGWVERELGLDDRPRPTPGSDRDHPPLWWWLVPVVMLVPVLAGIDVALGPSISVPAWLGVGMATLACAHLATVAVLPLVRFRNTVESHVFVLLAALVAGAAGAAWLGAPTATTALWLVVVVAVWIPGLRSRSFFSGGVFTFSTYAGLTLVSAVWGAWFLVSLHLSTLTTVLLWAAALPTAICLPSSVVQTYEAWETLVRVRWRRPRLPSVVDDSHAPRVMIHVPVHAEPPEVVIATLDRIAALDYANYTVLVIDNNTEDEALWRPVEAHCASLGDQFAFVHVMGVVGAKAGALNLALRRTPADVELVAVVDADYQVRSNWLRRTVRHFADDRIAFVQGPHAYRNYQRSRFGQMANEEYRVFFETSMVAYNERDAALTVGTMCVVRRTVLDQVGGWAEWCLTEDSELSVRIHAAG
ncbi:MAG TPA: glycosyltransferase, partial [Microthrixaceae bacterium]|nr:glycosyltransferase [Microthrixaceae bacterium]